MHFLICSKLNRQFNYFASLLDIDVHSSVVIILAYIFFHNNNVINFRAFLVDLQQRGVTCCYDNVRIASAVDILFLCILPSQLQQVVDGIKEHLRNESIIYSFIPTIPRQKICALLSHQFVIQTEYEWNESCDADNIITDSLDVVQALENDSVLLLSCPLGSALKGIIYYYDCVFACSSKQ